MTKGLKRLRLVSLFSGIGGLDLGFIKSGCRLVWVNDSDKNAVKERLIFIGIRRDVADADDVNASDIFMELINKERQLVPLKSALYGLRPLKASRIRNSTKSGNESSGHVIEKNERDVTNRYLDTINHDQIFNLVYNHKARYNNRRDRKIATDRTVLGSGR